MNKYSQELENLLTKGTLDLSFDITRDLMTVLLTLRGILYGYRSTSLSPRTIHHYKHENIIPGSIEPTDGRRKYNFYEVLWLHIIDNLRGMGYPLKQIKLIKQDLFDKPLYQDEDGKFGDLINFNAFEFIITMAILSDERLYMIIVKDGSFGFVSDKSYLTYGMEDNYRHKSHLNLPLSDMISQMFDLIPPNSPYSKISAKWDKPIYEVLSHTEQAIVVDVRLGVYDRIEIQLTDGKKVTIKKGGTETAARKVGEAMYAGKYKEIALTTKKGKVVKILRGEKERT